MLLGSKAGFVMGRDSKVTALVFVKESAEDRRRIKVWPATELAGCGTESTNGIRGREGLPAHEVNTAVDAHEGTGSHVPNQPIVLDWQVACNITATRLDCSWSSHCLAHVVQLR